MPELHVFTEPQNGASYARLARFARATEECGFAGFFRSDHYLTIHRRGGLPGPTDSWVTLAGLALETKRIRLGTLMTCATFRLPGPLAIAVAQVDQMSQGRVDLGIGAGWYAAEHAAYGVPFPNPAERFERLAEQLEILTSLWATPEGSTYSFVGRHYQLKASPALPKPWQRPGPPILIGGMGKRRTPELAARFAAEFNVAFVSVADAGAQFEVVRQACRALGRDAGQLRLSAALTVACGDDRGEANSRSRNIGQDPERLEVIGAVGSPAQVVERIEAYARLGCQRIYLQLLDLGDLDHLELLAGQVLPAFA
ncbi:MAG TPA: LLM class F420-dependent oxidoreductase [Candidatus Dormibacteraeota bacterium]|nr:LLM class F420-dependent oxidoreductase [Candidatus Dormibacteraeota bacterium]